MLVTQFEWLADGGNTDYPFAGPAVTDGGSDLREAFADAFAAWHSGPFAWLALTRAVPGTGTWDITIADDAGVSLTLTLAAVERGPWTILSGGGAGASASFLLSTEKLAGVDWGSGDVANGRLAPRAAGGQAGSLLRIGADSSFLSGSVNVFSGYNMEMLPADPETGSSGRAVTELALSAVSGAGEGAVPCDDPECRPPLMTINQVSPNAGGNIVLAGDDCYSVEPALEEGLSGLLTAAGRAGLRNDCSPCCDCSDYGYVYDRALRPLYERAKVLTEELTALRERYSALYAKYLDMVACRRVPAIEMTVTGMYNYSVGVAVCLKNNSDAPWPASTSPFTVTVAPAGVSLVPGSVEMSGHPAGRLANHTFANGALTVYVPPIPCCTTVWLAFEFMWPCEGGFVSYRVEAHGDLDGVAYDVVAAGDTLLAVNRE